MDANAIEQLRQEAARAGDDEQVRICDRAFTPEGAVR